MPNHHQDTHQKTPYETLDLHKDADNHKINEAYKSKVVETHPVGLLEKRS